MRLLLRAEQNEIYKELVEILKSSSAIEGPGTIDVFKSIKHIAAIVGGAEMLNSFGGNNDLNREEGSAKDSQRDAGADSVSIQNLGREAVRDSDASRGSRL